MRIKQIFLASTFLPSVRCAEVLRTGLASGLAGLPTFFSIAFLTAAISSVNLDKGLAVTYASNPPCLVNVRKPALSSLRDRHCRYSPGLSRRLGLRLSNKFADIGYPYFSADFSIYSKME
ncbi:MAG: hypothetical protein LBF37_02100 [Rickettsiales bacterium]|jgi:hypothetical protein|nr:hypothetical protein [Rickettsiales bacterium]